MGYIPIKVQFGSQENMWMKEETSLDLDGFWEMITDGRMLRKTSSDNSCITLRGSVTR